MPGWRRARVTQDDGRMGRAAAGPAANQRSGRREPLQHPVKSWDAPLHHLRALDIISTRWNSATETVLRDNRGSEGEHSPGVWMRVAAGGQCLTPWRLLPQPHKCKIAHKETKAMEKPASVTSPGSCQSLGSCGKENELTPIAMNLGPVEA